MNNRVALTCYLAGYIEAAPDKAFGWRDEVYKALYDPTQLLIYDPIRQEAVKTGKVALEHVKYVIGLKKAGKWDLFTREMNKIWLGNIKPTVDLGRLFELLKDRANVDGNRESEMSSWGDYEGVARSEFVIAYIKKDIQTIGTIGEIFEAMLLKIPIYLIIDTPKTDTNSTLLYWVMYSAGEIFYDTNKCIKFIKEKYNLKVKE